MFLKILKPISRFYFHLAVSLSSAVLILSFVFHIIAYNSNYYYSLIETSKELIIAARASFTLLVCGILILQKLETTENAH